MSDGAKRTRVFLSGEKFFRVTGNHGIRFLESLDGVRVFFEELLLLVNRGYLLNRKLRPEDIAMSVSRQAFMELFNKRDTGRTVEEAMDLWITLLTVGYEAFADEAYLVISRLNRIEGTIKLPHLSITVRDVDTSPDEDLVLFITYDYLPF